MGETEPGAWIVTSPIGEPPEFFDLPDRLAEGRWPTRADLDVVAPDNPVHIPTSAFWPHPAVLNSAAPLPASSEHAGSGVEVLRFLVVGRGLALSGVAVGPLEELVDEEHGVVDAGVQVAELGEAGGDLSLYTSPSPRD